MFNTKKARGHFNATLALPSPRHRFVFRKLARFRLLETVLYRRDKPFLIIRDSARPPG